MAVFLVGASLLGGCATSSYPPAPSDVTVSTQSTNYRLGPLDKIEVFVWRSPELSAILSIRPDGHISMPLIEDMLAAGRTPQELAKDIEVRLKKFVAEPIVTVLVRDFTGALDQQVRVIGQTQTPSAIPYRSGMTVLDVMIAVGGLKEFADGDNAVLVRKEYGSDTSATYSLKLDELIRRGKIQKNVPVMPGDVIIIPESMI
jgi:polysaccharide export outer membrane protein